MASAYGPERYPVRDPRVPGQRLGRIWNPPRFMQIGGLNLPSVWNNIYGVHRVGDADNSKNIAPVDKATKIGKVRRASGKDDS